MNKHP